ncbi:unnamed protein product [Rhizoctonia solani]|nr:unnamed protein product [Rhizoctonia solani]
MTTSPDKLDSRHGQDTMTSPSATITPSIRYSSDLSKEDKDKEGRVTVVDWLPDDPENPMNWKISYRRFISLMDCRAFALLSRLVAMLRQYPASSERLAPN